VAELRFAAGEERGTRAREAAEVVSHVILRIGSNCGHRDGGARSEFVAEDFFLEAVEGHACERDFSSFSRNCFDELGLQRINKGVVSFWDASRC